METVQAVSTLGEFGQEGVVTIGDILKYMGNTGLVVSGKTNQSQQVAAKDNLGGMYTLDYKDKGMKWFVVYQMPKNDIRIEEKLEGRAKSVGLWISYPGKGHMQAYTAKGKEDGGKSISMYPAMLVLDFSQ